MSNGWIFVVVFFAVYIGLLALTAIVFGPGVMMIVIAVSAFVGAGAAGCDVEHDYD